MNVRFCECDYELDGPELRRLRTSNDVLDDIDALRARIASDGYLFLKGYLDRDQVLKARQTILNHMDAHEGLEPGSRPLDGVMGEYGKTVNMMGRRGIARHEDVLAVLESPKLRDLYERIFGEDVDVDKFGGWFTSNPRDMTNEFGGVWATDNVEAGDLITFGMHLMHASTTNKTDHWRISCDVRWQPADDTMDERWAKDSTYHD